VPDGSPRAFAADIEVRRGETIGVRLAPGATIGLHTDAPGSKVVRWDGGLAVDSQATGGTRLAGELMLRVDVEAGARAEGPPALAGAAAASAPSGRRLGEVSISAGAATRAVLVELPAGIALDTFARRRLGRLAVPDADPEGELLQLTQACGRAGGRGFCLRWRNPGTGPILFHAYRVARDGRLKLIG
jgi:hypothetical protein